VVPGFMIRLGDGTDTCWAVGLAGGDGSRQWPEAFGFAVLGGGLVALGRLCRKHDIFPASLGALAYLEALLLLGIAVTGLIPNDAGYNWLSLAAGAVVGPVLSVWLGIRLGQPETPGRDLTGLAPRSDAS
jgi:hypothetical protein